MIFSRTIGDIKVTNIIEYSGPTHDPAFLFPDLPAGALERNADWLAPAHFVPHMRRFIITIQIWVVHAGNNVIVIDTGVGNHKQRAAPRTNMLNTLVLPWLEATGATAETVTHVVNTHLHPDHVGWNTRFEAGAWLPTFPNARHIMPKIDFDFFKQQHDDGIVSGNTAGFVDSVLPIHQAGLVDFIEDQAGMIAGCLEIEPAPGHTPGMVTLRLRSGAHEAHFSADIFHSPLQIAEPGLNTAFCILPEPARASRAAFLARAAQSGALVMPCHFGAPYCGYIHGDAVQGYRFEPEARKL
jgi:glyoxylase-like metal-dependent hydrolase (beta-lactamase superfamily II)